MEGVGRPPGDEAGGRCAYQGAPGAFSHEACLDLRPWDEAVAYDSFEAAIAALQSGEAGCALIPVENTSIGRIEPAASLVEAAGLNVVSEVWRPIRLALMGPPGSRLGEVRTAESHPAALGQCTGTLAGLGIQPVEAFDTAGAARAVAEAGDPTRAAVAPVRAAEVYELSILRNDIQDSEDNRTRFVLLSPQAG
ncbi:MAG: prephenate dehydratase domain-containing protein [Brevundimonas sp.]|uniref:prephenate dehydratase domain-containing protein n=1 Tax=Brevundimonas sp. TaxID=1871086 RepID=UPI00271C7054|nr:prephenate dehydratase domain-containing protein [Brevundimonas sp.]MDO9587724.1 prephenate dehydratase domain-containing protein [Brevundimonas sp.]MDP3368259.1 prephenate dehydratase domain-containing protein [Brevundimonas sp.]MDP3657804.1 prephenate dehydratase domain-containing protein [Brevundimonas sp.]MDZ4108746.1 prephenate dehydratase domain-containing protein [Brevundimonas sp.]